MSLIVLIITLALVGLALWVVVTYVPMPDAFRRAVVIIVVLIVILYALRLVLDGVPLRP